MVTCVSRKVTVRGDSKGRDEKEGMRGGEVGKTCGYLCEQECDGEW